jgi:hypothetical protein
MTAAASDPGRHWPLAHSPVDMPAGYFDEVDQLALVDVVTPHYQTDRRLA